MADDQANDAPQEQPAEKAVPSGRKTGFLLWSALAVAIVAACCGGGIGLRKLLTPRPSTLVAEQPSLPELPLTITSLDHEYIDLPMVTVTLNEQRMARYISVQVKLAVGKGDSDVAGKIIAQRQPELVSWLHVYLSGCSLDDVRGDKSLNRLLRVIQDEFNERLWPGRRPVIVKVLFHRVVVQ